MPRPHDEIGEARCGDDTVELRELYDGASCPIVCDDFWACTRGRWTSPCRARSGPALAPGAATNPPEPHDAFPLADLRCPEPPHDVAPRHGGRHLVLARSPEGDGGRHDRGGGHRPP